MEPKKNPQTQITKAILRIKGHSGHEITLPDLKLYHKVIVIKPIWYWQKNTEINDRELRTQK